MKVFVTGATGFIGGNLVRILLERGHTVRCLARSGSNRKNIEGLAVEVFEGDLRDAELDLTKQLRGCEALFHVAAVYSFWTPDAASVLASNVQGTRRIIESAMRAGVKRIVYTSSETTIGISRGGVGTEESVIAEDQLHGAYKVSKHRAEVVALNMWREYGIPVVVVNPTMPIGAYDIKPTPTGQVVVDFLNHRMPAYVNTGMNLVDVEDVCVGHILAMERGVPGERYILGSRNVTFSDMLRILEKVTGIRAPTRSLPIWAAVGFAHADEFIEGKILGRPPRVPLAAVKAASKRRFHDCSKAVVRLGMPQSPVDLAFARAVGWFRQNGYAR